MMKESGKMKRLKMLSIISVLGIATTVVINNKKKREN